ncbi:DUF2845 domain-containing protein [Stutzerimonas frequens]|jgi:hypothetical protein|uniref:DUF2845 domain-containing protein n=1 Tax=Stutzerimonas frequens TaxID=2968969 RepID=UPI000F770B52|nr:DUF2845 domain-containing protein [Stutzerimonas frequens]RRV70856.1 DUF2845 domain-containing protein [Stutzerimonas stutzeri]MBK3760428.1 DUF2845 domain-containing protein [Stutzerimonas frequens]MBK3872593.1 DUF2845 domain-containing protein [Stutzerimonas frequens]MBK3908730.1 DUF2845 domain-containing protein [Stutzerimonas frequens]MBK3929673.1 DUF2845 domain-containing protein [Stutzerimonas frequens]
MKKGYLLAALLISASATADTLRCGNQLVTTGDRTFEVERKCGAPQHRDVVGYRLGRHDRHELTLEEWVYGPRNGMLSILTFEGNRLVRIETRRAN